jgi:hypothetical protein
MYPAAEQEAMQKSINLIDVYWGEELMTTIDIAKHRHASNLYQTARQVLCPMADFN